MLRIDLTPLLVARRLDSHLALNSSLAPLLEVSPLPSSETLETLVGGPMVRKLHTAYHWLLTAYHWLLTTYYLLLATGDWLLTTGY